MEEYTLLKSQRRKNLDRKRVRAIKRGVKSNSNLQNDFLDTKERFSGVRVPKSTLYDCMNLEMEIPDISGKCQVIVRNQDTIDMALYYCSQNLNPLVLNMASDYCPGGGVNSGKTAQEECLFRCTNAFMTHPKIWYPLEKNQIIYSPQVTICKDSKLELIDEPMQIGMIAVPAIRKPKLERDEYCDRDYNLMAAKIEALFRIAIYHKHDSLILGSLGCGVFKNPPKQVAEIFRKMVEKYGGHFKVIGFAVLIVKSTDQDNYDIFKRILE